MRSFVDLHVYERERNSGRSESALNDIVGSANKCVNSSIGRCAWIDIEQIATGRLLDCVSYCIDDLEWNVMSP